MDQKDWVKVIDHTQYFCRSWQYLYFEPRVVLYIRIVGTKNTVNKVKLKFSAKSTVDLIYFIFLFYPYIFISKGFSRSEFRSLLYKSYRKAL